jgi:MOSC domain-containing protein
MMEDVRRRVDGLYCYPVKSCRGTSLDTAVVGSRGIVADRQWMIVDEQGDFLSQRELPRMALVRPRLIDVGLELSAPGMPPLSVPPSMQRERTRVTVWNDRCAAVDEGPRAAEWLSTFLAVPCRLVRMPDDEVRRVDPGYAGADDQVGFADGFSFLLTSRASLDDLNRRLPAPLPMNRFRPSIVVVGSEAFEEDRWKRIRIDGITFAVVKPCARCAITTTDQETGERSHEPLRTLATFRHVAGRGVMFGQNLVHDRSGVLHVGAEVEVIA